MSSREMDDEARENASLKGPPEMSFMRSKSSGSASASEDDEGEDEEG